MLAKGQSHKPWRTPSRMWCDAKEMKSSHGSEHHESFSLHAHMSRRREKQSTGTSVEQCSGGRRGRFRAA